MSSETQPPSSMESEQVEAANRSGRRPLVLVHGLWLLASSWARWRELFESNGYTTVAAEWPDDPATVEEARRAPEVFAGKGINDVTNHIAEVIGLLERKPAIIGHSFGGLIVQKLAGMGLASVTVPIDPAPFRGVLPLPFSALKAASPVLSNPANRKRSVMLTYEQFRYAFANAVDQAEARDLYETYAVPGSGLPLFQAALANLQPKTEAAVDTRNPARGPMKFIAGEKDNTAPWAITHASYKRQRRNPSTTVIEQLPRRGHSLVIDSGWEQVARTALAFIEEHQEG
ncbi:MAG: putative hydrolase or acyltransferase (alpha/beta hydrolase superfamily) [Acidimicrobiaceae bacterium]|nr:putative hydrolase or acyltransferase (alpha/beta hydrolase superfamily) [Acidimicrobiaceae bacterium]